MNKLTDAEVERIIKLMDILVREVEDAIHAKQPATTGQAGYLLDRGFNFVSLGPHIPTVTIGFAPNDWGSRDAFAKYFPSPPIEAQGEAVAYLAARTSTSKWLSTEVVEPTNANAFPVFTHPQPLPAPAKLDAMSAIHSCGYFFDRPECIRKQRDEMRDKLAANTAGIEIREAAQAVVDRWNTPLWTYTKATAKFINRLRAALDAHPAPAVAAIPDGLREALELVICESEAQCEVLEPGCVRCDATVLLRKYFSLSAAPIKDKL